MLLDLGDAGLQRLAFHTRIGALVGAGMWPLFEPGVQSPRAVAFTADCVFTAIAVLAAVLT
ncbi:hypothetical protein [Kitasatospora sp. NPDC005856]|uniref:hypothetical protein n=1 Tax=Kitasatospora sp. NPDC005856 TaxID=3154566 RepID=UPI0033CC56CA